MTNMPYVTITGVDTPVSRIAIGTVVFSPENQAEVTAMLDRFIAAGGNAIDTARHYGDAENAIGAWLRGKNREDIVMLGKGAHPHGQPRITREDIAADIEESLRRLGTDYLDVFLLHRDNPKVPVADILDWLNEHREAGRIHAYGGSNWTVGRVQEANAYAAAHDLPPFVSSPNLSLAYPSGPIWPDCRSAGATERAWYAATQLAVVSWSSQAEGFFTGRYSPEDRSNERAVRLWYTPENWARYGRAEELGRHKGVSTNSIALAYVMAQPFPTIAAIGPHKLGELESSLEALDVSLSLDEATWLETGQA